MMSKLIWGIILKGNLVTCFKVHDIRKFVSSLSLMHLMDVKDLLRAMKWEWSSAFFRHYLTITSRPLQPLALPGGPSIPDDSADDPAPGTSGFNTSA